MPVVDKATPCILMGEGPAKKDIASDLLELEVDEDHELAGVFRIRLAIIREKDGLWTYLDDDPAKPWQKMEIQMNVGGQEEPVMQGYVTQVRVHVNPLEGNSYLELAGMDATCLMSLEEVLKDWAGKTDSDIATAIFGKYNRSSTVESTGIVHDPAVTTILQRESDIQFLEPAARRNGFECVIDGDMGYFVSPDLDRTPLPELAAHFAGDTNLTSFDANWNALRPTAVEFHQVDTVTKGPLDVTVEKSKLKLLGSDVPPAPLLPPGSTPRMFVRHAVATGQPEMQKLADGLADEASWFIEAKGEVDSTVYGSVLHARRRVPIKGVGQLLSGLYYLTAVKHIYKDDKYLQQFTARRNATTPKKSDFKPKPSLF